MFDPIKASKDIKESYIDYITTTFDMADSQYKKEFLEELRKEGMIAKGPFLDIGGSFEVGHTLQELINNGSASPLFEKLEPVAEKDRELKLNRPLYRHQETSHNLPGSLVAYGRCLFVFHPVKRRAFSFPLLTIFCVKKSLEHWELV